MNRTLTCGLIAAAITATAASLQSCRQADTPFFETRGIVLFWTDVNEPQRLDWLEMAERAGINTLSVYTDDGTKASDEYRAFIARCADKGIDVEYQEHAMGELLPRSLFDSHPEYFRMNEQGERCSDYNCCPASDEAMAIIAENAKAKALRNRPTNDKYYFWMDDGGDRCHCDKCRHLNDSDQALMIENRILRAVREVNPRAQVAHLSYHNTLEAPATVKPDEGIFLEFAPFYRSWDKPLADRDAIREGMTITHGEYLDALENNLKVFPASTAQVLEYWMDVSLFSGWKRPAMRLPWNREVFLSDLDTYARHGIRHITCYAAFVDGDYYDEYKDVGFVDEYGAGLRDYSPEE